MSHPKIESVRLRMIFFAAAAGLCYGLANEPKSTGKTCEFNLMR